VRTLEGRSGEGRVELASEDDEDAESGSQSPS
jgi:hypothetical protein